MKVYNQEGSCANADKNQIEILLDSGWSLTKPEPEVKSAVPEPIIPETAKKPVKKLIKRASTIKKD